MQYNIKILFVNFVLYEIRQLSSYIQIQLHIRTVICRSEMYNGPEHLEIWWIKIYCEGIRIFIILCIVDGETGMANVRMASIVNVRVI